MNSSQVSSRFRYSAETDRSSTEGGASFVDFSEGDGGELFFACFRTGDGGTFPGAVSGIEGWSFRGSDFGLSSGLFMVLSARLEWGFLCVTSGNGSSTGTPAFPCCDATITLFFPIIEKELVSMYYRKVPFREIRGLAEYTRLPCCNQRTVTQFSP